MITMNTTLSDAYKNPVGKDIMDRLLRHIGRSPRVIQNPVVGKMTLAQVDRLLAKKAPGLMKTFVRLVNYHPEAAPKSTGPAKPAWWKEAVVYQVYPRSFQDSNGDGIGDLTGIRKRVPYLKELGVDVVWLSPVYDSPNDDNGYDIRNYRKIMKDFGSMRDFNQLLAELHKNDIKLIMDLVVNHTSDEHEWYKKALADPESPQRDYYIWAEGKGGETPPNNWISFFSGPAWNYDEASDEWALHLFSKKQMDLNWDNPDLRAEIYNMVNWWLDKGVDGFRLDVINLINKDSLADGNEFAGKAFGFRGIEHYFYGPRLHEYLQEMRAETFAKYDAITVGETPGVGLEMGRLLCAEERGELDMIFNFDHLDNPGESRMEEYQYNLRYWKGLFTEQQTQYGSNCWPSIFFENHDNPRMISKIKPDAAWRPVLAKLIAVLQFTLRGTPFLYQGQEIGMTNCQFHGVEELRDVDVLNRYAELATPGQERQAFQRVAWGTRDHARTPMQWSAQQNAGFTEGEPWIKVNPNYPAINVETERQNPDSVLNFYKDMIALRKESTALIYGEFKPVFAQNKNVLCYFRIGGGQRFYVEINLTGDDVRRPGPLTAGHNLVQSNYPGTADVLRPYEANVYRV